MAKLSEFLGELVSSISSARVRSDLQSIRIAEEYAKDELLQHFTVPRMRVDKVELSIPVAVEKLIEKKGPIYEPIDTPKFSSITYDTILKTLEVRSLDSDVSKSLKTSIANNIKVLEAEISVNKLGNSLRKFSETIASETIKLSGRERVPLFDRLTGALNDSLKDEIKLRSDDPVDSLYVVVEADKLREIKPENIVMIKMTVSEQGMEWIKMKNNEEEIVSKLMPE
jgi:hypothetical protein